VKGLTDVPGVLVGHATNHDARTGCTAILTPKGAVAGYDIRGSATGTSEFDLMSPLHLTQLVHGVCLSGGSAFGLEAACGVRNWLAKKNIGFDTKYARVPLVPGAILYDLGIANAGVRPGREMGEAAAAAASDAAVAEGCVGAGTGCTVGKALGLANAMKSGVGSYSVALNSKVTVGAIAAVNAFGDVVQPKTGNIVAGARTTAEGRAFADTAALIRRNAERKPAFGNTTLVVVATNARLTKPEATKIAQLAQQGFVRAVSPVHTVYDGDLAITLSCGQEQADVVALGVVAADVVAEAIVRAAYASWTVGGVPGLAPIPARQTR
jgi:L-aminopeptidase/D-esterase-like protein